MIARIYEVFALVCPMCGGQMRLIAFITEGTGMRKILEHIGVDTEPPQISPARGPPLWDGCDAQVGEDVQIETDWAAQTLAISGAFARQTHAILGLMRLNFLSVIRWPLHRYTSGWPAHPPNFSLHAHFAYTHPARF